MGPNVTLTAYNMGDMAQDDYMLWVQHVAEGIDEKCGFEVGVDYSPYGGPDTLFEDKVSGTEKQREIVIGALSSLWDDFTG